MLQQVQPQLQAPARPQPASSLVPGAQRGVAGVHLAGLPAAARQREKAQRWLLSISATDHAGLLYGVAQVLAQHHINVLLAKISTLGERVEVTFLIDGPALQHNKTQIDLETQLLSVIGSGNR